METNYTYKQKRAASRWKPVTIMFVLFTLVLLIAVLVTTVVKNREIDEANRIMLCDGKNEQIDLTESKEPGVFRDLTTKELNAVLKYLMKRKSLKLVTAENAKPKSSYIHHVELIPPKKEEALAYLDDDLKKPERWAKAVIFRGDLSTPQVEEYRVGPLPRPKERTLIGSPISYAYRPASDMEHASMYKFFKHLDKEMAILLEESYDARFVDCGEKCLSYFYASVSSHAYGDATRHFWFTVYRNIYYTSLHPVDLLILVNVDSVDPAGFTVREVRYGQQKFQTVHELMDHYNNNKLGFKKYRVDYPTLPNATMYSNMKIRGKELPRSSLRPPSTYEPDGKRYTIKDQHITYMGWAFDLRMVTSRGPALYDVRFLEDRIAYEISLQELAAFYGASSPAYRMADYLDSAFIIGPLSKALVPGYDCPSHATFIPAVHVLEASKEPTRYENALCVFEIDTGVPLHRHHSHTRVDGPFYGGMSGFVLTVRAILTVANYDYIIDYIFHQSGALEVKVHSTGYIITGFPSDAEKPYGWTLRKGVFAPVHHHMFNFKVDIDIQGTSNRFEKLNILPTSVKNLWSDKPNDDYNMIKYERTLIENEEDARYNYDFSKPAYLIFHNDEVKTNEDLPKAYRLHPIGMAKSLLPPDENAEVSVSWARQQVAVTTYKDEEERSSSVYAFWDSYQPRVKFDNFINNESIIDQDLVAWVTLGTHHLPHTEDLPVTPTPGAGLSFTLTPYNYFPTCPSFRSRDGLYMDVNDKSYVRVQEEGGIREEKACKVKPNDFVKLVQNDPKRMFDE